MTRFKYILFLVFYLSSLSFSSAQSQSARFDVALGELVLKVASTESHWPDFLLALQDSILVFIQQQKVHQRFHSANCHIDLKELKLIPVISSRNSHLGIEVEIDSAKNIVYYYLQVLISGYGRRKTGRGKRRWAKDYELLRQSFSNSYPNTRETHRPNGDRPAEWAVLFYQDAALGQPIFRVAKFQGGCLFRRGILLDYIAKNTNYQP